MIDPTGFELELSRFWNDLTNGDAGDQGNLDLVTADAVRRLQLLASAPLPGSARERVWRGLHAPVTSNATRKEEFVRQTANPFVPNTGFGLNGQPPSTHVDSVGRAMPVSRRTWARPAVLIAIGLLVIAAAGGWWWIGAPFPGSNDSHAVLVAPVVTPEATPDPASYNGVLIDLLLTNQPLSTQYIDVEKVRFNSGYSYGGNDANGSNFVEVIIQGELTVTVDGPTQILRGFGADPEPAAAGVPQFLRAGDAIAIGPHTRFKNEHNGDLPAIMVSFNLLDPNINAPSQANDVLWQLSQANGHFAPGPLRVVVRRVTLQPGESYSRPTAGPLLIFAPEDPNSSITGYLIGDAANYGKKPEAMFVITFEPVAGIPATPVADFSS